MMVSAPISSVPTSLIPSATIGGENQQQRQIIAASEPCTLARSGRNDQKQKSLGE